MFETLVSFYDTPLYFSEDMAQDAGVSIPLFRRYWDSTEDERTLGRLTLEEALEWTLAQCGGADRATILRIAQRRTAFKRECFQRLHGGVVPMLEGLKSGGIRIGLISNCFSEEQGAIRDSVLFPYFDVAMLSCEQGLKKPDKALFMRCVEQLGVSPQECLYVGDGGSRELETAMELGMTAVQAVWYLRGIPTQECRRSEFTKAESPDEIVGMALK